MPPVTTPTRQRLISAAHELFYTDGFHSVGLDRILGEVGVTKTTFYNHFQSKEDLVLEVLRHHDRWWRDTFLHMLRESGGETARGQLLAIFDILEELFTGTDYNGCIFINVAVEFPLRHDPAHVAAAHHKQAMEEIVRELAREAGAKQPKLLAEEITLLMEGAYVTAHVTGEMRFAEVGKRVLKMLVERHLPSAASPEQGAAAACQ